MKNVALLILTVGLVLASGAQTRSGSKSPAFVGYKLVAVKATGTSRYTDKEILAASGLQIGQNAADADFKEAARHLGDSGLFSDVVYSFTYSDTGAKLEFHLTDADPSKLVPANFENFVWFTDAELLAALEQRVPLFKGLLPVSGRLADLVSEALQSLLSERRFLGRVDFLRQGRQDGGNLTGIVYKVEEVSVRVRNLEFPGASPEQSEFLTAGVRKLVGVEYSRSALAAVAKFDLMPLYLQRGYLKANFGPSDARVVTESDPKADKSANESEVDAILPVTPGKVYAVSGVNWTGNASVKSEEASHLFHLVTGQPANAVRLAKDAESLTRLYRSRGYMKVQVQPEAQMDDDASTVRYDINVIEGDLYRMGELEIVGVDSQSKDRLREAWTLHEGDPYNAEYPLRYLQDVPPLLPKGMQYTTKVSEDLDARSKTVDVTIHFKLQ
jgi:outer membrane protein insertion porin family